MDVGNIGGKIHIVFLMQFRFLHIFLNIDPFLMKFVPFESSHSQLSNGTRIIKNGSILRKIWRNRTFFPVYFLFVSNCFLVFFFVFPIVTRFSRLFPVFPFISSFSRLFHVFLLFLCVFFFLFFVSFPNSELYSK